MIVGVISDTHGLLRPEALAHLRGCDCIIHAGDIGSEEILPALHRIAPVYAIRGNIDVQPWARKIPSHLEIEIAGLRFFVIHHRAEIKHPPRGTRVLVVGHSHQPLIEYEDELLLFNPGSAGPRRFKLPITMGRIHITRGVPAAELIDLA